MSRFRYFISAALIASILFALCPRSSLSQSAKVSLQGVIKDPNGDLIAGVQVFIENGQNLKLETATDERGRFRFDAVAPGAYSLKAVAAGFASHEQPLRVGGEGTSQELLITLKPTIAEVVTVNEGSISVTLDPQNAAGSQVLREKDLKALPDDPDQFSEQLKMLATSSGSAPGQAITTVDGFTIDGRLPPKSAIREVRINPDLFSAEYEKAPYQGGRIQIYTRPGSLAFNGAAFFNYNNSVLNARDAFTSRRAPSDTERYGFDVGGPIIKKRMGLFVGFREPAHKRVGDRQRLGARCLRLADRVRRQCGHSQAGADRVGPLRFSGQSD